MRVNAAWLENLSQCERYMKVSVYNAQQNVARGEECPTLRRRADIRRRQNGVIIQQNVAAETDKRYARDRGSHASRDARFAT